MPHISIYIMYVRLNILHYYYFKTNVNLVFKTVIVKNVVGCYNILE